MRNVWMISFLTLIWAGFSNDFSITNIALGLVVSFICCNILPTSHRVRYHINLWPLISLLGLTLVELVKSSVIVAWDVITPKQLSTPKIIHIDIACRNDVELTLLTNLISLTPGTLSIDLLANKTQLKVHVMFADDASKTVNFIKHHLEPKVMKVFNYGDD